MNELSLIETKISDLQHKIKQARKRLAEINDELQINLDITDNSC